jgi:C-terminal processing protease CtpA/Prc/WD40 repeat protein
MITRFVGEDRQPVYTPDEKGFYYLSEASGCFNVHRLDFADPQNSRAITAFKTHPVRFLSMAMDGTLCYTHNGELYTQKEGQEAVKPVVSLVTADKSNDAQIFSANGQISEMAVSPDGKEVAFIVRGEVFATSVEGTWTKRITDTPAAEAFISYGPEGKTLIYASERDGRWGIYQTRRTQEREPCFFASTILKEEPLLVNDHDNYQPRLSPDGKWLAYIENRATLRILDMAKKESRTLLDNSRLSYMSEGDQYFDWSPDSQWLVVEFTPMMGNGEILLVKADASREPLNLTESGYGDFRPRWVDEGKQLLWLSDRNGLRSYANSGSRQTDVYTLFMTQAGLDRFQLSKEEYTLQKELEEKQKTEEKDKGKDKKKGADKEVKKPESLVFDWNNLLDRKKRLTIHSSFVSDAVLSKDGETLYYLSRFDDKADLWSTEIRSRETKVAVKLGVRGGRLEWDKEQKSLYLLAEGRISKLDLGKGSKEPVSVSGQISLDLSAERRQMFEHVWHRTNAMFYTPQFHGIDWNALYQNYSPKLTSIGNDREFAELLSEMLGELNVSHCGARYRHRDEDADRTAALGMLLDHSHRGAGLRIAEIVTNGPLDKTHLSLKAGTVIEAVNGTPITTDEDWARLFNRLDGQQTALLIRDPQSTRTRTITVKPITLGEEADLLYERWVKKNEDEVQKLSKGRLGYVHIPGMADGPYRQVYEKAMGKYQSREGLIVDTRFNGGGDLVGDMTMFLTGKQFITYATAKRDLGVEPGFRWTKPSVAMVNEDNYSDGHCFACAYQELGIGKMIGMPVPGTCSFAGWEMLQNGRILWGSVPVSARNMAGEWMENNQTVPDIVVRNMPGEIDRGRDEQLEKAVSALLDVIANN